MSYLGTTLNGTPRVRAEAKSKTGITRAGIDVRRLARVKVVERGGRLYCYFNLGNGRKPERLPDPMSPRFEQVYALLYMASRRDIHDPTEGAKVLFPQKDPAYREYLGLLRDLKERGVILPPLPGEQPRTPQAAYALLWTSLHGAGSWEANPWVVALTFRVERENIDRLAA